jgi:hypothetical protein
MARYTANMGLTAKIETTAGTDAAPAAGTDGMLFIKGMEVTPLDIKYAQRNLQLPYFGGSQQLLASYSAKVSFEVEWAGGGAAALATTGAPWGPLLQACGTAQAALTVPARIEHTPAHSGLKTATLYIYDDGVLHKLIGAVGECKFSAKQGEVPRFKFEFMGTYVAVSAVTLPAITLTAWEVPLPVVKANVVDITLGCTYAAGVLTGGTAYPSMGLEIAFGNKMAWLATLSAERAELTDRAITCNFTLELTAAQEVAAYTDMAANTLMGLGFTLGTGAGIKQMIFAPKMQRTNARKVDEQGVRLIGFDGVLVPDAGDDELRFIQL